MRNNQPDHNPAKLAIKIGRKLFSDNGRLARLPSCYYSGADIILSCWQSADHFSIQVFVNYISEISILKVTKWVNDLHIKV